jgi:glucosamine-6-phosphate deaminase
MRVEVHPGPADATRAAAGALAAWLEGPGRRNIMVAAGNTPLDLYREIGERALPSAGWNVFALDEYVGVPLDEPRSCAGTLRRAVAEAWRIPPERFFTLSSLEEDAMESVAAHERRIAELGGIDVLVLGLGRNGHIGFNEPGSEPDSTGRVVDLEPVSVAANREWFGGRHAPSRGVTTGMRTLLASRHILLLAHGAHKAAAAARMVDGPRGKDSPASLLQGHPDARVFLDEAAAAGLEGRR